MALFHGRFDHALPHHHRPSLRVAQRPPMPDNPPTHGESLPTLSLTVARRRVWANQHKPLIAKLLELAEQDGVSDYSPLQALASVPLTPDRWHFHAPHNSDDFERRLLRPAQKIVAYGLKDKQHLIISRSPQLSVALTHEWTDADDQRHATTITNNPFDRRTLVVAPPPSEIDPADPINAEARRLQLVGDPLVNHYLAMLAQPKELIRL